jgi:hypothetical protein
MANVFDGGPRTQVNYEIGRVSGGPRPMQHVSATDPAFCEMQAHAPDAFKPWVKPINSSHLWSAPLPEDLAPGAYRLSVMLIDEYGRKRSVSSLLEVGAAREELHAALR